MLRRHPTSAACRGTVQRSTRARCRVAYKPYTCKSLQQMQTHLSRLDTWLLLLAEEGQEEDCAWSEQQMQAHLAEQTAQLQDRQRSSLAAHPLSDWGSDFGSMTFSRTSSLDSSEGSDGAGSPGNAEAASSSGHSRVFAVDGAGSRGDAEAVRSGWHSHRRGGNRAPSDGASQTATADSDGLSASSSSPGAGLGTSDGDSWSPASPPARAWGAMQVCRRQPTSMGAAAQVWRQGCGGCMVVAACTAASSCCKGV